MTNDRLVVESARRILRDWLEMKGIEVDNSIPKTKTRQYIEEKLAFRLDVQIPSSVLSRIKAELNFENAVSQTREFIETWQKEHPAATEQELSEWKNNYVTWCAEDFKIDRDELVKAITSSDRNNENESTTEDARANAATI